MRWHVHHQGKDRFVLVSQDRRLLVGWSRLRWINDLSHVFGNSRFGYSAPEFPSQFGFNGDQLWVDCADDAGRWISEIVGPTDAAGLIAHCDAYIADPSTQHNPHDEVALPFLLRKMLVEQGYEVPGVERIVAC